MTINQESSGIDFGALVNALPGLVCVTDAEGRGCFFNHSWQEYTGRDGNEALNFGWQGVIHSEDLPPFLESFRTIKESGIVKEIQARLRRGDGEYRWFAFHASVLPQSDNSGPRWCWLVVNADEGAVLDGRLRRFIDMLPWQAGFLDKAGVLEFTNLQSLRDFGMTYDQLQQWLTSGIIHVEDHEPNRIASQALLQTGELYDLQLRMLYPGGGYRWTRARCVPVRDAQGNALRYVTFQIDVDDLKRAEALLAAEVNVLEMVARGEPLGRILEALCLHVEALCSDSSCGILLVAADKKRFQFGAGPNLPDDFNRLLEGRTIDGAPDPCSAAALARRAVLVADVQAGSKGYGSEWSGLLKTHGYASSGSLPILASSGEASGVITVYRTKTVGLTPEELELVDRFTKMAGIAIDRTQVEEGLNRARAELAHVARVATLSTMTASITHEVSQPIAGILTNASTLVRMLAADPPNLAGAIETVRRTLRDANRAAEVIKRLRAMFSKNAPTIEEMDLNEAAREVVALSTGELQRARAVLEVQFTDGLPLVSGDRVQLQQVILNLLLNAVDAMAGINDRPRRVLIQTARDEGDSVRLLVRDSGVGIDPQAIEKLFDAFYTTKAHGMGVGLAISRSIIRSHKGNLWAAANDGPGATFGFRIPSAAAQLAAAAGGPADQ